MEIEIISPEHEERCLNLTIHDCDSASERFTREQAGELLIELQEILAEWDAMPPHQFTPRTNEYTPEQIGRIRNSPFYQALMQMRWAKLDTPERWTTGGSRALMTNPDGEEKP